MKKIPVLISLVLGLGLLPACAVMPSVEPAVSESVTAAANLPAAAAKAQTVINEVNVALTAAYRQLPVSVRNGVLTPSEGLNLVDELDRISLHIDEAQSLVDLGSYTDAESKANAAKVAFEAAAKLIYRKVGEQ